MRIPEKMQGRKRDDGSRDRRNRCHWEEPVYRGGAEDEKGKLETSPEIPLNRLVHHFEFYQLFSLREIFEGTKMTTVPEFLEKVKREVGFGLVPTFQQAFPGVEVPGDTLVIDLAGQILRKAGKEDVVKWNEAWNRHAEVAYKDHLNK
jgi:hypothetical protein